MQLRDGIRMNVMVGETRGVFSGGIHLLFRGTTADGDPPPDNMILLHNTLLVPQVTDNMQILHTTYAAVMYYHVGLLQLHRYHLPNSCVSPLCVFPWDEHHKILGLAAVQGETYGAINFLLYNQCRWVKMGIYLPTFSISDNIICFWVLLYVNYIRLTSHSFICKLYSFIQFKSIFFFRWLWSTYSS